MVGHKVGWKSSVVSSIIYISTYLHLLVQEHQPAGAGVPRGHARGRDGPGEVRGRHLPRLRAHHALQGGLRYHSSLHMITIFTQFMVGTRRGKIVSCRMSPKQGSSNMILGVFDDLKRSRVMAVDRNTFYPKNFLVIRWLLYFKMFCLILRKLIVFTRGTRLPRSGARTSRPAASCA